MLSFLERRFRFLWRKKLKLFASSLVPIAAADEGRVYLLLPAAISCFVCLIFYSMGMSRMKRHKELPRECDLSRSTTELLYWLISKEATVLKQGEHCST